MFLDSCHLLVFDLQLFSVNSISFNLQGHSHQEASGHFLFNETQFDYKSSESPGSSLFWRVHLPQPCCMISALLRRPVEATEVPQQGEDPSAQKHMYQWDIFQHALVDEGYSVFFVRTQVPKCLLDSPRNLESVCKTFLFVCLFCYDCQ
jgi:hypothetical protein